MLTMSTPDPKFTRMDTPRKNRRPDPRPYHHGNLRRALLDEALVLIGTEGVDALTLRKIGARVGVSRTALYRHFADKQALLTAVATEGFRELREQLVAAWEDGGRTPAASQAMGVAYVRFALDNPSHYRVMFSRFVDPEPQDPQLGAEAAGAFQALVDVVAKLQQDGLLRADETALLARYIWAVVHGVAMLAIDGQIPEPGGVDALMEYALQRLRTGTAAPGDGGDSLADG